MAADLSKSAAVKKYEIERLVSRQESEGDENSHEVGITMPDSLDMVGTQEQQSAKASSSAASWENQVSLPAAETCPARQKDRTYDRQMSDVGNHVDPMPRGEPASDLVRRLSASWETGQEGVIATLQNRQDGAISDISIAGIANHTSDFIGGLFGERSRNVSIHFYYSL